MKTQLIFVLIGLIEFSLQTEKFSENTPVLILTSEIFKEIKIGFQNLDTPYMVMFYAPWCPHCKRLIPTWEKLAEKFSGQVAVGAVDCTVHDELCQRFEIRGYPTLTYFSVDNQMYNFKSERSLEKLSEFIEGGYKRAEFQEIPQHADRLKEIKRQLSQPSVMIAIGVLSLFTIILIVVCVLDASENKKLRKMEQELAEKEQARRMESAKQETQKTEQQQQELDEQKKSKID